MRITTITQSGLTLTEISEGIRLSAYLDDTGKPTIGMGTTVYPNGVRVKIGDTCTTAQAYEYLAHDMHQAESEIVRDTVDTINQNQFNALCDFVYNKGDGNYETSTLLKMVNANPNDPAIRAEFGKWIYEREHGVEVKSNGLIKRAALQASLYFTPC